MLACGDGNIQEITDPSIQRNADIEIIEEFLAEEGYTDDQIDTTDLGVRYVILDAGTTEFDSLIIDESDIVDFDYIGRLTTDTLFDTSIRSVAEGTSTFNESRVYAPLTINYTTTGWAIQGRFVTGFSDGITNTFNKVSVGGHVLIAIPSNLAYGALPPSSLIPVNAVLIFELFPVSVRKQ